MEININKKIRYAVLFFSVSATFALLAVASAVIWSFQAVRFLAICTGVTSVIGIFFALSITSDLRDANRQIVRHHKRRRERRDIDGYERGTFGGDRVAPNASSGNNPQFRII